MDRKSAQMTKSSSRDSGLSGDDSGKLRPPSNKPKASTPTKNSDPPPEFNMSCISNITTAPSAAGAPKGNNTIISAGRYEGQLYEMADILMGGLVMEQRCKEEKKKLTDIKAELADLKSRTLAARERIAKKMEFMNDITTLKERYKIEKEKASILYISDELKELAIAVDSSEQSLAENTNVNSASDFSSALPELKNKIENSKFKTERSAQLVEEIQKLALHYTILNKVKL